MGCGVINADLLAKRALDHPTVKCRLVSWWGEQVLDDQLVHGPDAATEETACRPSGDSVRPSKPLLVWSPRAPP